MEMSFNHTILQKGDIESLQNDEPRNNQPSLIDDDQKANDAQALWYLHLPRELLIEFASKCEKRVSATGESADLGNISFGSMVIEQLNTLKVKTPLYYEGHMSNFIAGKCFACNDELKEDCLIMEGKWLMFAPLKILNRFSQTSHSSVPLPHMVFAIKTAPEFCDRFGFGNMTQVMLGRFNRLNIPYLKIIAGRTDDNKNMFAIAFYDHPRYSDIPVFRDTNVEFIDVADCY